MANQKLTVALMSAVSEAAANNVLKAAGVPKGASEIVRDANGKVIQVIIHLPATASEKAIAAIKATPGVADIQLEDVPEGFDGWDMTQAGLDAFVAAGYTRSEYVTPPIITFNEDGTMTYTSTGWASATGWRGYNKAPVSPLPIELEMRVKTSVHGSSNIVIEMRNDVYGFNIQLQGIDPAHPGMNTLTLGESDVSEDYAYVAADDLFHVIKATISDTGLMTVFYDGVSKLSKQLSVRPSGNWAQFSISSYPDHPMTVDYARWTERP